MILIFTYYGGYEELFPQFGSREEYYEVVKPRRVSYLRGLIEQRQPKVVICYGKLFWEDYRSLFEGHQFVEDRPFQKTIAKDTLVILTPHFTARTMNRRFDAVASMILSNWQP